MAAYDDLNVKRIFTVGILSILVTAVTALAVQVLYYAMLDWQQAETAAASDYRRQNRYINEQTEQISSYGVDAETGNITIPISEAISQMVGEKEKHAEHGKDKHDET